MFFSKKIPFQICEVGGSSKRKVSQVWLQSKEKITIFLEHYVFWLHPRSYVV